MKMIAKLTLATLAISATSAQAAYVADARSNGMGNTGVVSSDYLNAPFHNPALGALFTDNDRVALLLPAVGAQMNDSDDFIDTVDSIHSVWDGIADKDNLTPDEALELDTLLKKIASTQPVSAKAGLGASLAIPTYFATVNLFAKGYTEVVAVPQVETVGSITDRYENSVVGAMAFGVADYGISLSRNFNIAGQQVAIGISPKMQTLMTYSLRSTLDEFDFEDYDQNEISDSAFNFDVGAAWNYHGLRVGAVMKNVLAQSIEVADYNAKYELEPQITVGVGYVNHFLTASVDMDVTTQTRFSNTSLDDTKMLRFGLEGDLWGWIQGRAGYEMDMEDNLDSSVTAGLGFSPFRLVHLDLAASYAGEKNYGASANLSLTF